MKKDMTKRNIPVKTSASGMWLEMVDKEAIQACLPFGFLRGEKLERRWEIRKARAIRYEDETVDWVESNSTWLKRFADELLAKNG
jgi:hypothetical protein